MQKPCTNNTGHSLLAWLRVDFDDVVGEPSVVWPSENESCFYLSHDQKPSKGIISVETHLKMYPIAAWYAALTEAWIVKLI